MLKTSKLLRLHDEILNINSYKVTEHEDIATESTSKLGLSLHIQDDNNRDTTPSARRSQRTKRDKKFHSLMSSINTNQSLLLRISNRIRSIITK